MISKWATIEDGSDADEPEPVEPTAETETAEKKVEDADVTVEVRDLKA